MSGALGIEERPAWFDSIRTRSGLIVSAFRHCKQLPKNRNRANGTRKSGGCPVMVTMPRVPKANRRAAKPTRAQRLSILDRAAAKIQTTSTPGSACSRAGSARSSTMAARKPRPRIRLCETFLGGLCQCRERRALRCTTLSASPCRAKRMWSDVRLVILALALLRQIQPAYRSVVQAA